jgi:hypothetical protein
MTFFSSLQQVEYALKVWSPISETSCIYLLKKFKVSNIKEDIWRFFGMKMMYAKINTMPELEIVTVGLLDF